MRFRPAGDRRVCRFTSGSGGNFPGISQFPTNAISEMIARLGPAAVQRLTPMGKIVEKKHPWLYSAGANWPCSGAWRYFSAAIRPDIPSVRN